MTSSYVSRIVIAEALSKKCESCAKNRNGNQCPIYDDFLIGYNPEEVSHQNGAVSCTAWEVLVA